MRLFRLWYTSGDFDPYPGYERYLIRATGPGGTATVPIYIKVVVA